MIVLDASATIEALISTSPPGALLDALTGSIHAPYHLDVEVLLFSGRSSEAA